MTFDRKRGCLSGNAEATRRRAPFGWHFRLHRTGEFKATFAARRYPVVHTSLFSVYRRDNGLGHARLGLAISRKFAGKAVDRNRIKRRIRETFREQSALPSMDFVVACAARRNRKKLSFSGVSSEEIRKQLLHIWTGISSAR